MLKSYLNDIIHELLFKTFTEISILQDVLMNYRHLIQDRTNAIAWLNDHLLTPSLITLEEFHSDLSEVEAQLMKKYPPFHFAIKSVEYSTRYQGRHILQMRNTCMYKLRSL
jgi:hypothetical protein